MKLVKTALELEQLLSQERKGKSVGFLPTMGALHEGHLTLARRVVKENDIAVCSVFVNPTQFNNKTDLETYPRNIEADAKLLEKIGVDFVFVPDAEEFYTKITRNACGIEQHQCIWQQPEDLRASRSCIIQLR